VLAGTALLPRAAAAGAEASASPEAGNTQPASPAAAPTIHDGREYLVPELAEGPFAIQPGRHRFLDRLSFSPAFGRLGDGKVHAVRAAYHPQRWLGWEATIGHNPGRSVHALTHSLDAVLRWPLPGRFQPYGAIGYGMILVFPGEVLNSDPVTGNLFEAGGGLEIYVRDDLAVRFDARHMTVPGRDAATDESVSYGYAQWTAGLAFHRDLSR